MKTCNMLVLILFPYIFFMSCSDDDKDPALAFDSLAQTSWHGIMIESYNGGEIIKNSDIGMIFYTEERGQYDIKGEGDPEPERESFTYIIEDKILRIRNVLLTGYWLLIGRDKETMILEQSIGGEYSYKATLTLTRTH
ncbi:MAG: hypothetical protein LUG18_04230 [Candidatus Azobacteroides sp.]|nr:hypothetical protein [Candidatus Azobacteroides sp.]